MLSPACRQQARGTPYKHVAPSAPKYCQSCSSTSSSRSARHFQSGNDIHLRVHRCLTIGWHVLSGGCVQVPSDLQTLAASCHSSSAGMPCMMLLMQCVLPGLCSVKRQSDQPDVLHSNCESDLPACKNAFSVHLQSGPCFLQPGRRSEEYKPEHPNIKEIVVISNPDG